jgi:tyrosine-protein kinase Etk/Wzc
MMSEQMMEIKENVLAIKENNEIHILDLLVLLGENKKLLFLTPLFCLLIGVAAAFFIISPKFLSKSAILPPQQQQGAGMAAMLGQLGGLAGAAGGIAGLKNPSDLYVGMLESRTVADNLIKKFDLKKKFDVDNLDDARKKLGAIVDVSSEKSGIISIAVEDTDAKFSAELANSYVSELSALTQSLAITDASQRRLFFEKQLVKAKNDLAESEIALRNIQKDTGIIQLEGQVRGIISTVAQLEGTIAVKEVQLGSMRSFATNNNPEVIRLQQEIQGLQGQVEKLKRGPESRNGDALVSTSKLPDIGVEYIRGLRDVKYNETIFELLSKQYELAKIDEAKETSNIQVLDKAVPAEKRSKPRRIFIMLGAVIVGFVFSIFFIFMREFYRFSRKSEKSRERWAKLSKVW